MPVTTPLPRTPTHTTLKAWMARRAWVRIESIPFEGLEAAARGYMLDVLALYKRHLDKLELIVDSLNITNREFFLYMGKRDLCLGYDLLMAEVLKLGFVEICLGKTN